MNDKPTYMPAPAPTLPVTDLGGGNTRDARGVVRYRGWSSEEALSAAVSAGTSDAWEWLKDWHNGEMDDERGPLIPKYRRDRP